MPFGLVNAPAVFQAVMSHVLEFMDPGEVLAYMDDVVIPSKTVEERLDKFLGVFKRCELTLRLDKYKFLTKKVSYLGHLVIENRITPVIELSELQRMSQTIFGSARIFPQICRRLLNYLKTTHGVIT